jgi:hypothetical protein
MTSRVRASILALTFAAIVTVPSIAAAQDNAVVGVKAGVNFAKLKFSDDQGLELKNKVGAVAGLFVSKAINDNVGIRAEGLFSQKGAKVEAFGESGKFKVNYFDVPVLLTFGPSSGSDMHFNFFTGPQLSFKLKAESEFGGETQDEGDSVKGTDFGWVVGVGLASGRFSADARYALGLSNINKDADGTVKNRTFSVMVGVNLTK